MRNLLLKRKKL